MKLRVGSQIGHLRTLRRLLLIGSRQMHDCDLVCGHQQLFSRTTAVNDAVERLIDSMMTLRKSRITAIAVPYGREISYYLFSS